MTRYANLYAEIAKLEANHKVPVLIPKGDMEFPFDTLYPGQKQIIESVGEDSACITSHTGFGKTGCFLALTRGIPSIIIEPRKHLQHQASIGYYQDFVLYGRSGYPCPYAPAYAQNAAHAPCLLKVDCSTTTYHDDCPTASKTCMSKECKVFPVGTSYAKYPCTDCEYMTDQKDAKRALSANETVICNFGNFWSLIKSAKMVVVDEADLFFRSISTPMKLKYSLPRKYPNDDIKELLTREVSGLKEVAKDDNASARYKAQNLLYNCQFMLSNHDLCFKYQRKDSFYIEIDPRNTNVLSQKLFKGKRVIIVSATPGAFELPSYSAEIHQRAGIYFAPVGNMTSRSLAQNPYLMNTAAKAITEISDHFDMVYDNEHVIIHAGNLGTHSNGIRKSLGDDNCVMHTAGRLSETISDYLLSGKRYLIVAAASHGGDWDWCKLQFVLKFPYPALDERMRTLERNMGPAFKDFYDSDARTQIIQISGRNCRGYDSFGVTVMLDSKCLDDYAKNKSRYPEWFRARVDTRCY